MAKNGPNKSFAAARRKAGFPKDHVERVQKARMDRAKSDPSSEIMDKVFRGEMTPEAGAAAIKAMTRT